MNNQTPRSRIWDRKLALLPLLLLVLQPLVIPLSFGISLLMKGAGPEVNLEELEERKAELERQARDAERRSWPAPGRIASMPSERVEPGTGRDLKAVKEALRARSEIIDIEVWVRKEQRRRKAEAKRPLAIASTVFGAILIGGWCFLVWKLMRSRKVLAWVDPEDIGGAAE